MIIAVDFDGTIVEHKYPAIGKERYFAFETLKMLERDGHQLILWTFREGDLLRDAVDFCKAHGVTFYAINSSYPGEELTNGESRKIHADIFVDDRNIGGIPGWGEIYQMINPGASAGTYFDYLDRYEKGRKGFICRWVRRLFCNESL